MLVWTDFSLWFDTGESGLNPFISLAVSWNTRAGWALFHMSHPLSKGFEQAFEESIEMRIRNVQRLLAASACVKFPASPLPASTQTANIRFTRGGCEPVWTWEVGRVDKSSLLAGSMRFPSGNQSFAKVKIRCSLAQWGNVKVNFRIVWSAW